MPKEDSILNIRSEIFENLRIKSSYFLNISLLSSCIFDRIVFVFLAFVDNYSNKSAKEFISTVNFVISF